MDHPDAYTPAYALDIELWKICRRQWKSWQHPTSIDVTAQLPSRYGSAWLWNLLTTRYTCCDELSEILTTTRDRLSSRQNLNHTYVVWLIRRYLRYLWITNRYLTISIRMIQAETSLCLQEERGGDDADYSLGYSLVHTWRWNCNTFEDIYTGNIIIRTGQRRKILFSIWSVNEDC